MRKIVMLLAFIPAVAMAQDSPTYGCYVDSTGYCSTTTITCSIDPRVNLLFYGHSVAVLCGDVLYAVTQAVKCDEQLQAAAKSATDWQTYGTYQAGLAKRLRRACGTKCRQIK